jgi:hypothetical protein
LNQLSLNVQRSIEKTSTLRTFAGFWNRRSGIARFTVCDMLKT